MPHPIESILDRLKNKGNDVLDLLEAYHAKEDEDSWKQDPRLYRAFTRRLIDAGHPTRAIELARAGIEHHVDDPDLKYLIALAFARSGNIVQAREHLDALLRASNLEPRLQVEVISLEGNHFKQRYARTTDPKLKSKLAKQSADCYQRAYHVSKALFPLINLATMTRLAGKRASAIELANIALRQGNAELKKHGMDKDYWLLATIAEAHLILGNFNEVKDFVRRALRLAGNDVGIIGALRRNMLLLKEKLKLGEPAWGLENVGRVVVFSGHMIDHPSRTKSAARFPPDAALEKRVSEEMRDRLEKLNATVGYSSAACGSDILFAEEMLNRRAELHIVLPFHRDDFRYTSVDFGVPEMEGWRDRCTYVLRRAKQVHYATTEHFLGDDVLFSFVNTFTQGLALTRAAERGVDAHALVVMDSSSAKLLGGTAYFLQKWRDGGRPYDVIDLAAMRSEVGAKSVPASWKPAPAPATVKDGHIKRRVKVMLFADVKGSSRLPEEQVRLFFFQFLEAISAVLDKPPEPEFANTWGDGLFAVFQNVADGAKVALRLLDQFGKIEWAGHQLAEPLSLRVGLHAGPVYQHKDPIIKRDNYFGSHVNRAARIEPVTTPGCAFASEQFAAMLAIEPDHDFICEFVGIEELAKGYDRCPLYRVERR